MDRGERQGDERYQLAQVRYGPALGSRPRGRTEVRCLYTQFNEKLESMRNFRPAFIEGTSNIRASTFKDSTSTAATTNQDDSYQHAPVDAISVGDWEEWIAD